MSSVAQKHMLHLAVNAKTMLVSGINSLFGFGLLVGFDVNYNKDKICQPCS